MSTQEQLFYEDIFDVLRAAVQAGGGAKAVGSKLWPHRPVAEAHRELLDCLNRERPRKFCPEEVMAILKMAREAGFHSAKHWIDRELGYEPTSPADPVVERDRLAEELAKFSQHAQNLQRTAERLLAQPPIRAVK